MLGGRKPLARAREGSVRDGIRMDEFVRRSQRRIIFT
jgi:hypothetical protein